MYIYTYWRCWGICTLWGIYVYMLMWFSCCCFCASHFQGGGAPYAYDGAGGVALEPRSLDILEAKDVENPTRDFFCPTETGSFSEGPVPISWLTNRRIWNSKDIKIEMQQMWRTGMLLVAFISCCIPTLGPWIKPIDMNPNEISIPMKSTLNTHWIRLSNCDYPLAKLTWLWKITIFKAL